MKRFECFVKHYIFFSFPATLSICMHRFAGRRTIARAAAAGKGKIAILPIYKSPHVHSNHPYYQ
jgi:hypothetical protein